MAQLARSASLRKLNLYAQGTRFYRTAYFLMCHPLNSAAQHPAGLLHGNASRQDFRDRAGAQPGRRPAGRRQDPIRSDADQAQVAQLLQAGCAHMRKAFDIEDINLDDLIDDRDG